MHYFLLTFFVHDETCVDAVSVSWSPGALCNLTHFGSFLEATGLKDFFSLAWERVLGCSCPWVQLTPEPHGESPWQPPSDIRRVDECKVGNNKRFLAVQASTAVLRHSCGLLCLHWGFSCLEIPQGDCRRNISVPNSLWPFQIEQKLLRVKIPPPPANLSFPIL